MAIAIAMALLLLCLAVAVAISMRDPNRKKGAEEEMGEAGRDPRGGIERRIEAEKEKLRRSCPEQDYGEEGSDMAA